MILLAAPQYQVTLFFLPVPVVLKLWVVVLVLSEAKLFLLSNMRGAYGIVECPTCFCVLLVPLEQRAMGIILWFTCSLRAIGTVQCIWDCGAWSEQQGWEGKHKAHQKGNCISNDALKI